MGVQGEIQDLEPGPDVNSTDDVERAALKAIKEADFPIVMLSDIVPRSNYSRQTVHDRLGDLVPSEKSELKSHEIGDRTIYYVEGSEDEARVHLAAHTPPTAALTFGEKAKQNIASAEFWWKWTRLFIVNLAAISGFLLGGLWLMLNSWPPWLGAWIAEQSGIDPYPVGPLVGFLSILFGAFVIVLELAVHSPETNRLERILSKLGAHGQRWLLRNGK